MQKIYKLQILVACLLIGQSAKAENFPDIHHSSKNVFIAQPLILPKFAVAMTLAPIFMTIEDNSQLCVRGTLSKDEIHGLESGKYHSIYMMKGSNPEIFDKCRMPNLRYVSIDMDADCDACLKSLALHQPGLQSLYLHQEGSRFSKTDMTLLSPFKRLKDLRLNGLIPEVNILELTPTVTHLEIDRAYDLHQLTKLQELTVHGCQLDSKFLENISSEELKKLDFRNVDLAPGSLASIAQFKRLQEVQFYNVNLDLDDLNQLKHSKRLSYDVQTDSKALKMCQDKGDLLLEEGKTLEALQAYRSLYGLSAPGLFAKRASCLIKLGHTDIAIIECKQGLVSTQSDAEKTDLEKLLQTAH